jgi:hypothetical protein
MTGQAVVRAELWAPIVVALAAAIVLTREHWRKHQRRRQRARR